MTLLRKLFSRVLTIPYEAAVGIIAISLVPTAAMAAQILTSGFVNLFAQSEMRGSRFNPPVDNPPDEFVAWGAPVEHEAYVGTLNHVEFLPFEGFRFFGIEDAFASAQINANGAGGVGISGLHETFEVEDRYDAFMASVVAFESIITNTGDAGGPVDITLQIPRIELTVTGLEQFDDEGRFEAFVNGVFRIEHYAAPEPGSGETRGELKSASTLFDYGLTFLESNGPVIVISDDLVRDAGPALPGGCGGHGSGPPDCIDLSFDPFEVTKTAVEDLLPNESIAIHYLMTVVMNQFGPKVPDDQSGGRAFYGDPIEISGRGTFQIHGLTPVPEPLPGTLGLLLLPGLFWSRARRKARLSD